MTNDGILEQRLEKWKKSSSPPTDLFLVLFVKCLLCAYSVVLMFSVSKETFVLFCFVFCLFRATPAAYGGSQARGLIGAVATGLRHSHSNDGSELHL